MTRILLAFVVAVSLTSMTTGHQNHQQQQNYQQVVNHQQQQQQQYQNQQFQQPEAQNQRQYQQKPPQAGQPIQQQQQQQQPPVHNGHGGHDQQMHANINLDHVLEHLDGVINKPKEQMSVEEQNFYYFKLHDYNNDNMLDGLELVSAFAHNDEHKDEEAAHQHQEGQAQNAQNATQEPVKKTRVSDEDLIKLIDDIMNDEDKNRDGYITYQEFLHAIKNT